MIWTHLAGNSLIRSFVHRSFAHFAQIKWATVSELLRSLKTNEWPWATGSGHSKEISGLEQIAQVAQVKCVTMSDSLRSLRGNERMSHLLKKFWLKNLKSRFNMFYIRLNFFFLNVRIAHFCSFPLFKWVMWVNRSFCSNQMRDVSESLRSLIGNERLWANCSGRSPTMSKWVNCSFFWANFWTKKERFARKSNERIPSPALKGQCHETSFQT